jgi:hypothetical protein
MPFSLFFVSRRSYQVFYQSALIRRRWNLKSATRNPQSKIALAVFASTSPAGQRPILGLPIYLRKISKKTLLTTPVAGNIPAGY